MNKNKFRLDFNLGDSANVVHSPTWVVGRLEIQERMRKWCQERIGIEEAFPHWQFSIRTIFTTSLTNPATEIIEIADGIFILDEVTRAAFKLTFEL